VNRAALCLAALLLCGCGGKPSALFREAAAETGIVFQHRSGAAGEFHMTEIMGSGAALFDFDNDGDLDVYLIQGAGGGNRLFRNELIPSGRLRFTDVTEQARVGHAGTGMGAATADYDGDGFTDLYVTNFGANVLYHNNGDGTFTDVTARAGLAMGRWSTSASFADYDLDGDPDLFVLNYIDFTPANNKKCYAPSGERDYCTPKAYQPVAARLFRNDGGGRFTDVTVASGIGSAAGPGLGVVAADVNGDGWPDFFVANDSAANLLWVNRKDGAFEERALTLGAAYSEDGLAKAGMGVAAGDYDNDGRDDLLVLNLVREGATLFRSLESGFEDVSIRTAIRPLTFAFTGFGTGWIDYDNDGWLDIFMANGAVTIVEALRGAPYPFHQKNLLLRNESGVRFTDVSAAGGAALELSEVSRAAAFGDIDNDGDIDIVVNNNNGPARLLLNETGSKQAWLEVKARTGTRVGVERAGERTLWRTARTDSSYLSAGDPRAHFGLGKNPAIAALIVEWPGGKRERLAAPKANQVITLPSR
jgi:hypothetical protein